MPHATGRPSLPVAAATKSAVLHDRPAKKCAIELVDPETGCEVVLLGCFHGAQSSAADVERYITNATDVVVLELCASRFTDLRRDVLKDPEGVTVSSNEIGKGTQQQRFLGRSSNKRSWFARFAEMVRKTSASRGLATGMAAAVLGGVSGLQTGLSGLQPGLEFATALRRTGENQDIVLADQNVDETLQKIGNLPKITVKLWKNLFSKNWEDSFGREAKALRTALVGDKDVDSDSKVQLWDFLTRSREAMLDLTRLTVPPFALLLVINQLVIESLSVLFGSSSGIDPEIPAGSLDMLISSGGMWAFNALLVGIGYTCVALPAARVILRERDDHLAAGIKTACRLIGNKSDRQNESGRVVAVLGFLHVNGVAKRLMENTKAKSTLKNS